MGTKSKWKNGILRFYNNAVVDENVEVISDVASTLTGYGLSVINLTTAAVMTLGAPVKGVTKDIVCGAVNGSTFVASIRLSTVANTLASPVSVGIVSPSTIAKINTIVLAPTTKRSAFVQLRGLSTLQWCLTSFAAGGTAAISFTTACT